MAPPLRREANWKIAICAGDHGKPHFHVETPNGRCSIAIETLEVIVGYLPPRILRAAIAWASANRAELQRKWKELNR